MKNRQRFKAVTATEEGKFARSIYHCIACFGKYSLIRVRIKTGRTHQIRVHMTDLNHPLLGDPVYGNYKHKFNLDYPLLHCTHLSFSDKDGKQVSFDQEIPEDFEKYKNILGL